MFKAEKLKDYEPSKFQPGYASIKRNGIHGIYTRDKRIFSRTPGQIVGLNHLYEPLHRCPFPLVFEIVIPGVDFETCSGIIRNFDPAPNAEIHIFNMVHPTRPFSWRLHQLKRFDEYVLKGHPQIHVEPMHWVANQQDFDQFYNKVVDDGEEGACWISPDHVYESGARRWKWMKRVPFKSMEAKIIDILPGTPGKKYEASMGKMVCELPDGKIVRVGIFKGQTDAWRQKIYDSKENYIGEDITFIYKTLSKYGIPMQPRFTNFRWDI